MADPSDKRCGAFPDPYAAADLGPCLPSCGRKPGHPPPHRIEVPRRRPMTDVELELYGTGAGDGMIADRGLPPRVYEWRDPDLFERAMRELEAEYGREALRMWVERAPGQELPRDWRESARQARAYDGMAAAFAEPSLTVDRRGGTYSITVEPIPAGWRGWLVRARLLWYREVELFYDMDRELNRLLLWTPFMWWDRWRRRRG
jgi:hypothetical protein